MTYQEIDAYLTGDEVSEQAREVIETAYRQTAHKRRAPPGAVTRMRSRSSRSGRRTVAEGRLRGITHLGAIAAALDW